MQYSPFFIGGSIDTFQRNFTIKSNLIKATVSTENTTSPRQINRM